MQVSRVTKVVKGGKSMSFRCAAGVAIVTYWDLFWSQHLSLAATSMQGWYCRTLLMLLSSSSSVVLRDCGAGVHLVIGRGATDCCVGWPWGKLRASCLDVPIVACPQGGGGDRQREGHGGRRHGDGEGGHRGGD